MRLPQKKTTAYYVVFVIGLVIFAYFILTDTRRVISTSMEPTLEPGDLVVMQSLPVLSVNVGDVIVYDPPCSATGFSVIHRVVDKTANGSLITQGDNRLTNPSPDIRLGIASGPVTQSCLVGKVVFVVPYVELLTTLPYGLNYVLAVLVIIAVIYFEFGGGGGNEGRGAVANPEPSAAEANRFEA